MSCDAGCIGISCVPDACVVFTAARRTVLIVLLLLVLRGAGGPAAGSSDGAAWVLPGLGAAAAVHPRRLPGPFQACGRVGLAAALLRFPVPPAPFAAVEPDPHSLGLSCPCDPYM
jgi:hypothetical protein